MTENQKNTAFKERFRGFMPVVVDIETGGFNAKTDAILEIAAVTLDMDSEGLLSPKASITKHIQPFPNANLDPKARENFYRLLKKDSSKKISLFVTHRLDELEGIINRQIYMDLGKIVSDEKI